MAVSGGIDSVALLRLMLELRGELGIVPSVVHFNHKLRGAESEADQEFVAALAREHDLELFVDSDDVAEVASDEHISIEAAAREVRYGFFRYLLGEGSENRQGLKPLIPENAPERGPQGPLFHGDPIGQGDATPAPQGRDMKARHGSAGKAGWDEIESRQGRHLDAQDRERPPLAKLLTAHTLDDQAETVLMRLIRGTGLHGMGGIYERLPVEDDDGDLSGEIVRPLLAFRRRELEAYLNDLKQPWCEDSTNAEDHFTRNRIRKLVLPLLEKEFNPAVAENLAELAEIARGEQDYWENEIAGWMGTAVHWFEPEWAPGPPPDAGFVQIKQCRSQNDKSLSLRSRIATAPWAVMNASVDRLWLLSEPSAVQRRLIKAIGDEAGIPLEFKHVDELLHFAGEGHQSGKELSLPLGWTVKREPDQLVFTTPDLRNQSPRRDYEYELVVPGQTIVGEAGVAFELRRVLAGAAEGYNPEHLLDAESLPGPLRVRNWRAGDRFWPAHTKSPKKVKELLQERHIPVPERSLWPVIASGDEIVWLRGYALARRFLARPGRDAILIAENPISQKTD